MTAAELVAWQKRCGLRTDAEAAAALAVAVATYRRKRTGHSPIARQTELLAAYYEVFAQRWFGVVEAASKLARLTSVPVAPPAIAAAAELITKVIGQSAFRR
jgi:hypothetical protein